MVVEERACHMNVNWKLLGRPCAGRRVPAGLDFDEVKLGPQWQAHVTVCMLRLSFYFSNLCAAD